MSIPIVGGITGAIKGITKLNPSTFSHTLDSFLDFHRTYLFRVLFFDTGITNLAASVLITNLIASSETPVSTTTPVPLSWQASKIKLAGKTDYNDWKVNIRDDLTNVASVYLQKWRDKIYDTESGLSSKISTANQSLLSTKAQGYKKEAIVVLMTNKVFGATSSIGGVADTAVSSLIGMRAYILHGIWPKELGTITLDYSADGIAVIPVSFSVDYYEPYSLTGALTNALNI